MSGIAGILHLDGTDARRDTLEIMADALSHRGPDGVEFFTNGSLGLVSLAFLTESGMHKPFYFAENAVVFDGRIDSLSTLSRLLKRKKAPPHAEESPAEIISCSHRYLNTIFPRCLLGDFALALWDSAAQTLILARDPFGIKPLYYYKDSQRFIFASEIKAILSLPGIQRKPNTRIVEQYKRGRHHTFTETFFEGIFRVPPAAVMKIHSDGTLSQKTYWEINPRRKIRMKNRRAYLSRFRRLFLNAVERRLPAGETCAFTLSGGLDSSSIIGAAHALKKAGRLLAVSQLCRDYADEKEYIQKVLDETGASHAAFYLEDVSLTEDLNTWLSHMESPCFEAEDPLVFRLYATAQKNGARVVLGGEWGDQVLAGTGYLADFLKKGNFPSFYRNLKLLPEYSGGLPKDNVLLTLKNLFMNSPLKNLTWRKNFGHLFPDCAQREMYEEVFHPLHVLILESVDKMAAMAGVEVRIAFLDRRLVEFLMAIPSEEKVRDGIGKRLSREGLKGILCETIAQRAGKGDYTDVADRNLNVSGFTEGSTMDLRNQWRTFIIQKWEDLWIKKKTFTETRTENRREKESVPTASPS